MKYYSLNEYLKNRFGDKVYKLAINGGFTCPNRDGTKGTGGCIFCSAGGSGDFAEDVTMSISHQIDNAKKRVSKKINSNKYIAYFQAFTNTYAPVEKLEKLYMEAISKPEIVALSIATRPDCLGDDVLDLLDKINKIKPLFVELGLQTINENTAKYIRRGYPLSDYDRAVKELKYRHINVVTHIILGLPNESKKDMLKSVRYVAKSGSDGIKLQLLHVLKGTDLEKDYLAKKFDVMELDEYLDVLYDAIKLLPKNMVVHRVTGDGAKKDLVAPLWSADKKRVLNAINQYEK